LPGMEEKVRRMAEAMEIPDHSVAGFITAVEAILDEIHIPTSLSEIGVPIDCAERIANKALKDSAAKTNPRSASLDEIRVLIETAITKAR
jgi:alcohol dehydrogenase class IV